jgi:hypothetical protein
MTESLLFRLVLLLAVVQRWPVFRLGALAWRTSNFVQRPIQVFSRVEAVVRTGWRAFVVMPDFLWAWLWAEVGRVS